MNESRELKVGARMQVAGNPDLDGGPASPVPPSAGAVPGGRISPGRRALRVVRALVSVLLIVLGVLSLVLSPVAIWGRNLLLDTNQYVETLAPLASNAGVQDAVVARVDHRVESHLDVAAYVHQVLPPRAATLLASPVQSAVYGLVNTVATKFVQSKAFAKLWDTINRVSHTQIVAILTGKRLVGGAVDIKGGKVLLNLSQVVRNVKDRLVRAGIAVASKVPVVGSSIQIAKVKGLESAQSAVRAFNTIADWLPWLGLALVAGGVAAARRHRRALVASALGLCAGMIVLGVGLIVGRNAFASGVPSDIIPNNTSEYIFDTLVRYLRWGIRLVFVVALLVALGAWVSGTSATAVRLRRATSNAGLSLGRDHRVRPLNLFVAHYANLLRGGVVALAGIVLLLINGPTAGTVIVMAAIAVVLLLAVEVLRAPVERQSDEQRPLSRPLA